MEGMYPQEWVAEQAQYVNNEVRDGTHDTPKYVDEGVPLVTSKNLKKEGIDLSKIKYISHEEHLEISKRSGVAEGDILFSMIGTIGNIALVPKQCEFSIKNVALFRKKEHIINPKFQYYWLSSYGYLSWLEPRLKGGTQKFISLKLLRESPIPLPPLAEQKEIAQRLDTLLAQVDTIKTHLDTLPDIIKRFRQSVLAAAVSGKLTEKWRRENGVSLDDWEEGSLKDFVLKPSYGSSSKSQKEGQVPVLRMGNIQNGKLDWKNLVYTSNEEEIQKYNLVKNDVLFNRTNSPELVGKTAIYKGERQAIYAGYLIKVQCGSDLNPDFLNMHLNSHLAKSYCLAVKSDGVSQSNINAQKLLAYPLIKPTLKEQTEIVNRVETLFAYADKLEQQLHAAKTRVDNLTQAILAKAFKGELTANWRKQHPELITGDNSAEALLEKIKAEREALSSKKAPKKKVKKKTARVKAKG